MILRYAFATVLAGVQAPSRDSLLAEGVRLAAMQPAAALLRFERILGIDSSDVAANWRAAIALTEAAQELTGSEERARRDSLFARAELDARRALHNAPEDPQVLFALGFVLGNAALSRGIRQRVRMAVEIRGLALRILALDSTADGAHHLLGRWNYEVMKLSGFQRFIARTILGGGVFGAASWDEAQRHLERATELDSTRIFHRLDLARVYLARNDTAAARAQLERIPALPDRVAADPTYRAEAAELLDRLHPPPELPPRPAAQTIPLVAGLLADVLELSPQPPAGDVARRRSEQERYRRAQQGADRDPGRKTSQPAPARPLVGSLGGFLVGAFDLFFTAHTDPRSKSWLVRNVLPRATRFNCARFA